MNVEEVLNKQNIQFRPSGNDLLVSCLNPEHEDSNPSMRIDKVTGVFNCLSCSFSGSIYRHFGINVSMVDNKVLMLKAKIRELYENYITIPKGAEPVLEEFRGISYSTLSKFQAFTHSTYEDRIVFPMYNNAGNLTGFNARHMYSNQEPKYIMDPPGMSVSLMPYNAQPINDSIILVEGIFDMLNLHDKGLYNSVCTFGTSFGATKKHKTQKDNLNSLLNFKLRGVSKIYIMYDGDRAGKSAAENLEDYISKQFVVEQINLEDGVDPGDLSMEDVTKLKEILYT